MGNFEQGYRIRYQIVHVVQPSSWLTSFCYFVGVTYVFLSVKYVNILRRRIAISYVHKYSVRTILRTVTLDVLLQYPEGVSVPVHSLKVTATTTTVDLLSCLCCLVCLSLR